jgi:hypothetical protein
MLAYSIHKTKTTGHKGTDRPSNNNSGNFNTSLRPIDRLSRSKSQQRNFRIK